MENIKFKKLKNTRDLGGIKVDGGVVKHKKFLRGPSLCNATKNDIEKLVKEYNLGVIIDLRTEMEREKKPDPEINSVTYLHMPIFNENIPGMTHESDENLKDDLDKLNVDFTKMYKAILKEEKYLNEVSKIIKTIMNTDEDKSVLFHCSEGKDRTGIIAAIILFILGASKEDVLKDYYYTNVVNRKRANKYFFLVLCFKFSIKKAKIVKNLFLAKPEYINSALDVIFKDYGGVDNFIESGLKLDKEAVNTFKEKYIIM